MPKALCITGLVISALLVLLFGVDMAIGFPFRRSQAGMLFWIMDIAFVAFAGILGYLSWSTYREQL